MWRRILAIVAVTSVLAPAALLAHDMFLKLATYFLEPSTAVRVPLLNGTFDRSENAIARTRIADLSVAGAAGRVRLDTTAVSARHDTTYLAIRTGSAGTYAIGVSTKPSEISLAAKQFTGYLEEEGLTEIVAERAKRGESGKGARERYSKHVKAIVQVGPARDAGFATALGYPAEIVPLDNPYTTKAGRTLRVRCIVDGQPLKEIVLLAGGADTKGAAIPEQRITTGAEGVGVVRITGPGRWYTKFIRMARNETGPINYESRWATLTFEIE